eukprot:CAMPEP_0114227102 /NCGR_PEP_ID=MMETSP0058-20121206/1601_1 /TAXON_ID=36894 /ORGANISM="Pyramimonas parkeae, CCMP726" /LENGTH=188 /DNA_ID=CAMNT_0001337901 /DNA_START=49 /DNA_END=615 /DNA_ORIENTATION=-
MATLRNARNRPAGTDGSDFMYRQRVDERYTRAANLKRRLSSAVTLKLAMLIPYVLYGIAVHLASMPNTSFEVYLPIIVASVDVAMCHYAMASCSRTQSNLPTAVNLGYVVIFLGVVQALLHINSVFQGTSNTVKVADYAAVRTGAVPEFVYGVLDFMNHVLLISGTILPSFIVYTLTNLAGTSYTSTK